MDVPIDENKNENDNTKFPEELIKIMKDFILDILNTFPEYKNSFTENELEFLVENPDETKLYSAVEYFKKVYPERFFDILYENNDMFETDEKNTKFFENIDFQDIWKDNISENTRSIIWKYLQLVLFSLSNNMDGVENFGDTAKLFEAIDEDELKTKLTDVISSMSELFDSSNNAFENMEQYEEFKKIIENMVDVSGVDTNAFSDGDLGNLFENFMSGISGENVNFNDNFSQDDFEKMFKEFTEAASGEDGSGNLNSEDLPDPEKLQEHLNSIMGGNIGKLAQEIADETTKELGIDTNNISSVGDVFSKLFKNPGKLTGMIKKVSSRLDEKIKSGEIKQADLMKEANDIMSKLQSTPGMKDMEKVLGKMGIPGVGGRNGKINMNLFKSMMQNNMKKSNQKDRMLEKLRKRQEMRQKAANQNSSTQMSEKEKKEYMEYIQKTFNIENSVMKKSKIKKKKKKKKGKKNKNK